MGEVTVLEPCHWPEAVWLEKPIDGVCGRFRLSYLAGDDVAVPDKRDSLADDPCNNASSMSGNLGCQFFNLSILK